MKWKIRKQSVIYSCLSFLVCVSLILSPISYIGSYASTTSGSEEGNVFERTEDYVRDNFSRLCRYVVRWNAVISDSIIGTWQDFTTWLENNNHSDIWEQHPHSPIRVQNGVENVEVPQEVLNVVNQYVIYQIQQTPTQYKECYISSYNFINTSQFNSYTGYKSVQELIKNNNGYTFFITPNGLGTNSQNNTYIVTVDVSKYPVNFIGTEIGGIFNTNVTLEHNWSTISMLPQNTEGIDIYMYRNGSGHLGTKAKTYQQAATNAGYSSTYTPANATNLLNTNSMFTSGRVNVFTNKSSNELVYLFPTINAYKNYNSGQPQPYYLTSDGLANSMSNWQVGSGTINTGTLSNANSTYSQVINNITSGLSADDVLKIVDYIVTHTDGNGSSDDEEEDDDNPITKLIKEIVGGIGGFLTGLIEGIADALLGEVNPETGLREGGLLSSLKNIFTSLLETLTGGVIFDFLSAFMSWLPEDIINVLTALFGVAVTFAVIKCVRNAL